MSPTTTTCPSFQVLQNMSKEEVEKKARENAKLSFIMESSCKILHPPTKVKMNGLYALLSKTDIVMDRTCLENPESIMNHLMKMETDMTLGNVFFSAFGQWYLCTLMSAFTLFWNEINLVRFYFWNIPMFWLLQFCYCRWVVGLKGQNIFQMLWSNH